MGNIFLDQDEIVDYFSIIVEYLKSSRRQNFALGRLFFPWDQYQPDIHAETLLKEWSGKRPCDLCNEWCTKNLASFLINTTCSARQANGQIHRSIQTALV
jgi:hypothetical protein